MSSCPHTHSTRPKCVTMSDFSNYRLQFSKWVLIFTRKDWGIFFFNLTGYLPGNSNTDFHILAEYKYKCIALVFAWPSSAQEPPMPSSLLETLVLMSCLLLPLKLEAPLNSRFMSCLKIQSEMDIASCYFSVTRRELAIRWKLVYCWQLPWGSWTQDSGPRTVL